MIESCVKFCDVMHEHGLDGDGYSVAVFQKNNDVMARYEFGTCYNVCQFLNLLSESTDAISGIIVECIDGERNHYSVNA